LRSAVIIIILALGPGILAQQSSTIVLFRSIDQYWDAGSEEWVYQTRSENIYDQQGNLVETVYRDWDRYDKEWIYREWDCFMGWGCEEGRETYSYDTRNNLIRIVRYGWDSGNAEWGEIYREDNAYSPGGKLISHECYSKDLYSSEWWGEERYQAEYDENEYLIQETHSWWEESYGGWLPGWKETYSYDINGRVKESVYYYWDEYRGAWIAEYRQVNGFNPAGQQILTLSYNWAESQWIGLDSTITIYDPGGLALETYSYNWDEGHASWRDSYRTLRTYDSMENLLEEVSAHWDQYEQVWIKSGRNIWNYDLDGSLHEYASYGWNESLEDWDGYFRKLTTYTPEGLLQEQQRFDWDYQGRSWRATERVSYVYDSSQHMVSETRDRWNEIAGNWTGERKYTFIYDIYGKRTSRVSYRYDELDRIWIPEDQNLSIWAPVGSGPVFIPDQALLAALIDQGVDTSGDGVITSKEAEAVVRVHIPQLGISDLTGLEAFTNLDSLDCSGNPLERMDLELLSDLLYLNCSKCELRTLHVEDQPGLESLICGGNAFEKLDLTGNRNLELLDLSNLPDLFEVCVWDEPFPTEDLELVTEESPEIYFTADCSVDIPSSLLYLALLEQGVDLNGDSLINRSEALAVTELDLSGYGIEDYSGLKAFSNLQKLEIRDNSYGWIDLSFFPALTYLDCSGSSLGNLETEENPMLSTLICRGCDLGSLNLSENPRLTYLDCSENYLRNLNITRNRELKYVDISNMPDLNEVCVWQIPFPPAGVEVRTANSFYIHYETECSMFRDRFEENDFLFEAGQILDNTFYDELAVSQYDGDWYELVPGGEMMITSISVVCEFVDSLGDINMDIVSSDGIVLASSYTRRDQENITFAMNPLDRYYLFVHLDSGQFNNYSISWIAHLYTPNCLMSVCDADMECRQCDILTSDRDTTYVTDTLFYELHAGDAASQSISILNLGPEPYVFYTSFDCSGMKDDRNYALRFDGIDDHVEISRNASIDLNWDITLEAWIWMEEANEGASPIISRILNGYGYELYHETVAGELGVGFRMDYGGIRSAKNLQPERWYHVAVTYDRKWIRLYINGIKDSERYVQGSISVVNQNVVIGSNSPMDLQPKYFRGKIDEIRIWNVARNGIEIQGDYQRQLCGDEEGLAGYWTLNHLYDHTVVDLTGHSKGYIFGGASRVPSDAPAARMIQIDPGSSIIPSGSAGEIKIHAEAMDLSSGNYSLDIGLFSNIQKKPDIRIPVQLQVLDAPSISVVPEDLFFGDVDVYETNTIELEVANHGTEVLMLDSLFTNVNGTRILPPVCSIPPGDSRTFRMDAFFRMEGTYGGELTITSNDPTEPEIILPIRARVYGITNYAWLGTIDDTLQTGLQSTYEINFLNTSSIHGLTLNHSVEYFALPGLINDRFFRPDSGNWIETSLQSGGFVTLPPAGSFRFTVKLVATHLNEGDYHAQIAMEWYNPFYTRGYLPIRLHVDAQEGSGTGLQPSEADARGIEVFPNPTGGVIQIKTGETEPYLVMVTTLTGQLVKFIEASESVIRLDLTQLNAGIYLITVRSGDRLITRRITKY